MSLKYVAKEAVDGHRVRRSIPLHSCVIDYSLMHYAGNAKGKSVMDLACGEGGHLRMLKMQGAEKAVGVDISEEMIRRAKAAEEQNPVGCTFQWGDMRTLGKIGEFDLITCVSALTYAETTEDLKAMCRYICLNLKKGGKLVAIAFNCHVDPDWSQNLAKYAVRIVPGVPNDEGRVTMAITVENPNGGIFNVENYWYPCEVMDEAFRSAGFSSYSFEPSLLDPKKIAGSPDGYWDDYKSKPNHTIYIAHK